MEITIKAIIATYQKIRKVEKELVIGEHEVRIRMTYNRKPTYIGTGYSSSQEHWDNEKGCPLLSHPKYKGLSAKIDQITQDIDFEIKLAQKNGRVTTPIEVKVKITSSNGLKPATNKPNSILAYNHMIIEQYQAAENIGYANIFKNWEYSMLRLLNKKDKLFLAFTPADHQRYEAQMAGLSESTKSSYLRTYYRIWNRAIEDGIVIKDHHPKQYIKFKAYKRIRTKKRAIKSGHWKRILNLKFKPETRMYRSHLLMQFLYYTRGMNFNDMVKLKREQFAAKGIEYKRSKNKRDYNFELHPKAVKVIEAFMEYPEQSDAGYLFPIIMKEHDTAIKIDCRIDSALKDLNEDMKAMAGAIGWEKVFTTYALRHGFASHLNEANVDIKIIKEALGHETEMQTRTYLDDIEDSIITNAINAALI
jgi:site-specific recombinase XerD